MMLAVPPEYDAEITVAFDAAVPRGILNALADVTCETL